MCHVHFLYSILIILLKLKQPEPHQMLSIDIHANDYAYGSILSPKVARSKYSKSH